MDVTAYITAGAALPESWSAEDRRRGLPGVAFRWGGREAASSTRYRVNKSTSKRGELGLQASFDGGSRPDSGANSPGAGGAGGGCEASEGEQLSLDWWTAHRRELRGHHADLTRLLGAMESGKHGLVAQKVGEHWHHMVRRCPGVTRRHNACGQLSFEGYSCGFKLCSWCQRRRSGKWREALEKIVDSGRMDNPMLQTFAPPNWPELTKGHVSALGKAYTQLRRRHSYKAVKGGVRSIEVTYSKDARCSVRDIPVPWNGHIHALVDSLWVGQYPQVDIGWSGPSVVGGGYRWANSKPIPCEVSIASGAGSWVKLKEWAGLAREWTAVCQNFPELKSPRLDFDINVPEHWYFVDIRRADRAAAAEVAKYITKGSDVVAAGSGAVVDFLLAMKGHKLIQPFGSLYGLVDGDGELVEESEESEEPPEESLAKGHCPWEDCPAPHVNEWEWLCYGVVDSTLGVVLEHDSRTGLDRVIIGGSLGGQGPGPPG